MNNELSEVEKEMLSLATRLRALESLVLSLAGPRKARKVLAALKRNHTLALNEATDTGKQDTLQMLINQFDRYLREIAESQS